MGSRFTRLDLEKITDYFEFESFANNLMSREGYRNIEPLGGHKDKGRDAIQVNRQNNGITIFSYSVRKDWKEKIYEDLNKIQKHGHECDQVVFVTTTEPSATEKDKVKTDVNEKYGWSKIHGANCKILNRSCLILGKSKAGKSTISRIFNNSKKNNAFSDDITYITLNSQNKIFNFFSNISPRL